MTIPKISRAVIPPTVKKTATDEGGVSRQIGVTGEYPLTLYVDKKEVVTLMTMGAMPECLAIGWLRNQRLLKSAREIEEVTVDWRVFAAAVYTKNGVAPLSEKRAITSGCGQGTMFGDLMENAQKTKFNRGKKLTATALFALLKIIREKDTVYKSAGAVHACALAAFAKKTAKLEIFVEDVGRHNAVDAIAGWMWLNNVDGAGKIFYTTGRLTSEMVIKCAQMKIPYLVSRSGLTRMGYDIAETTGLTMLGRAVNNRYLLYTGGEHFTRD